MKKRLFAMLLTLCMVLTLLPTAAFAAVVENVDPDNVPAVVVASVTIGGDTTYYTTWDEVKTAIEPQNGVTVTATIKLYQNVDVKSSGESALTIRDYQNITLDMGGKTMVSSNDYTIRIAKLRPDGGDTYTDSGSLTIIGTGTVDNQSTNCTTIRNFGTLTIGDPTKSEAENAGLIITGEGTTDPNVGQPGRSAIKNEEGSTLYIYGGTINGDKRSIQNIGTIYIYGGTFTSTVEAWKYSTYESTMTIDGGTFNAPIQIRDDGVWTGGGDVAITNGTFTAASSSPIIAIDNKVPTTYDGLSIQGGTFTGDTLIGGRDASNNGAPTQTVPTVAALDGLITGGTFTTSDSNINTYLADGLKLDNGEVAADRTGNLTSAAGTTVGVVTPYTISNAVPGLTYTIATDDPTTGISLMSFTIPASATGCNSFTVYLFTGGSVTIWETALALEFDDTGAVLNETLAALTIQ